MKKLLTIILAAAMVLSLAACGGSSSASTATSTKQETAAASTKAESAATQAASTKAESAATQAESAPAEEASTASADIDPAVLGTFEFSFTCHDPDTSAKVQYMQSLCDEVYEKTNGGVKMTMYNGGTLVASTDVAQAVEDGAADIGWMFTTFFPGEFPLSDVITLPRIFETNIQANEVLLDLLANNERVQEEMSRYHILSVSMNPMNTYYANKELNTPEDFVGLQLRAPAGSATEVTKLLGANPILMGPGDVYESIEKNVLDGYVFEPSGVKSFNLQEVTKYYLDLPLYCGIFYVVMNNDKWDSLPVEYQDIITEVWEKGSIGQTEVFNADVEAAMPLYAEAGLTAIEPSAEITEAIDAAAQTYIEEYIAANDCADIYEEVLMYKEQHPAK